MVGLSDNLNTYLIRLQIEIVMFDHMHQCYMSSPSQTDPPSVFF